MNEYKIELDGKIYLFGEETKRKIIKIHRCALFQKLLWLIFTINIIIVIFIIVFLCNKKEFVDSDLEYFSPSAIVGLVIGNLFIFIQYFTRKLTIKVLQDLSIPYEQYSSCIWAWNGIRKISKQIIKQKI